MRPDPRLYRFVAVSDGVVIGGGGGAVGVRYRSRSFSSAVVESSVGVGGVGGD
jgi:hypothetical protein